MAQPPSAPGGNPGGDPILERREDYFLGRFVAMGSPCELLVDTDDRALAALLLDAARAEALRVERKFSRYRTDNVLHAVNHSAGRPVEVDPETSMLLDYAASCHDLSGGLFDVTSGVLRQAWTFDGGDRVPEAETVRALLGRVGWPRVTWEPPRITLPEGMELDLGGIGKEYAVDRASMELATLTDRGFLVNFGGDLFAGGPRRGDRPWGVGVDDPDRTGHAAAYRIEIARGGLTTSGDARRFVMHEGRRLGHILDPRTGWPVVGAPRAVTVLAPTCLEAGTLSTLAILQGPGAREFLEAQGVQFWIL